MVQLGEKEITLDRLYRAFEMLGTWEERYKYVISLGKKLPAFSEDLKTDENYVHGCTSNVWMVGRVEKEEDPVFTFIADSDAFIVKGLIAILMIVYCGKRVSEINEIDIEAVFEKLDLKNHLSPNRGNGFFAMVKKIKHLAQGEA